MIDRGEGGSLIGSSPFERSWVKADELYGALKLKNSDANRDVDREFERVYTDAMDAHYREKGLMR